jgi:thiazole tautomerase (transcriptional regulator TenI)
MDMTAAELHFISGGATAESFIAAAVQVHPLVDYIHLRDKSLGARELAALGEQLLKHSVPASKLIVNDRVDVALAIGAAGVQLAWNSLEPAQVKQRWPELRAGRSVHSPEEAEEAFRRGADYVLFGHVFETGSKPGQPPRGLEQLAETVRRSTGPVVALGGIRPSHVPLLLKAGAAGYAVLSGIGTASRPAEAAAEYRQSEKRSPGFQPHCKEVKET